MPTTYNHSGSFCPNSTQASGKQESMSNQNRVTPEELDAWLWSSKVVDIEGASTIIKEANDSNRKRLYRRQSSLDEENIYGRPSFGIDTEMMLLASKTDDHVLSNPFIWPAHNVVMTVVFILLVMSTLSRTSTTSRGVEFPINVSQNSSINIKTAPTQMTPMMHLISGTWQEVCNRRIQLKAHQVRYYSESGVDLRSPATAGPTCVKLKVAEMHILKILNRSFPQSRRHSHKVCTMPCLLFTASIYTCGIVRRFLHFLYAWT